jgi:hypothetical protein
MIRRKRENNKFIFRLAYLVGLRNGDFNILALQ